MPMTCLLSTWCQIRLTSSEGKIRKVGLMLSVTECSLTIDEFPLHTVIIIGLLYNCAIWEPGKVIPSVHLRLWSYEPLNYSYILIL